MNRGKLLTLHENARRHTARIAVLFKFQNGVQGAFQELIDSRTPDFNSTVIKNKLLSKQQKVMDDTYD